MTSHTDRSRSGDLVERLRGDKYTCRENMGCGSMEFCACATMDDAADCIEALEAKVEGLRDLLVRGYVVCDGDDEDAVAFRNDVRAALGEKQ